jgi:uncharacterized membrane protein
VAQPEQIPRGRLEWLEGELESWRGAGLVDADAAAAIRARYHAGGRPSLVRLFLYLGAALLGVGATWLVAANLWDGVSPLGRVALVGAAWLACVVAAEVRDRRGPGARGRPDPVAGALRLLAALAYGGLVFQVAQSLQVPAFEPFLLGAWSLGALAYAYATGARAALLLGLGVGVGWLVWFLGERTQPGVALVAGLALAAPLAAAVAALHERASPQAFAPPWRAAAALLGLAGLFTAALPEVLPASASLPAWAWAAAAGVAALALVAARRATPLGRGEVAGAVLAAAAAVALVLLAPADPAGLGAERTTASLSHALVGAALLLALAVAVAADGALRSAAALTNLALGAIVAFVAVQSFAAIAPIASGATLFLVVGGLLVVTTLLAEAARRRLLRGARG